MDEAQEAVLVTGGASGIGLAVARGLLGAGRRVLVADVSQERLDEVRGLAPAERLGCVRLDVSDEAQVTEVMTRLEADFGPIAGLVNSAGIGRARRPGACANAAAARSSTSRPCRASAATRAARRTGLPREAW